MIQSWNNLKLNYGTTLKITMSLDELKEKKFKSTARVLFSSDNHIEDLRNEKSKMSCDGMKVKILL